MIPPRSFWAAPTSSVGLWIAIAVAFLIGCCLAFGLTALPRSLRRPLMMAATFIGGLYFVVSYLWPDAQDYAKDEIPRNTIEAVSFWLHGTLPAVTGFNQVLSGMLLGLGISSLVRVHVGRLINSHKDWPYSLTFVVTALAMAIFGLWDWASKKGPGAEARVNANPHLFPNVAYDFLFSGLFINLDAVMYSIIAFFIFSAAYRSFRLRSAEAIILLATAGLIMLSLMGFFVIGWNQAIEAVGGKGGGNLASLRLDTIKDWVQNNVQSPSIRAIEFGLGIGILAMSLRLWLGIEKGVSQ